VYGASIYFLRNFSSGGSVNLNQFLNPEGEPPMVSTLLLALALAAPVQKSTDHTSSFDVAAGQEIRMDLSAGEYKIVGGAEGKVRVSWWSDDRYDADHVHVRFRTENGRARLDTERTKDVRFVIEVPAQSNLHIRMSAGELSVSGVEGNKDLGLTAGELRVDVGDPSNYRTVHSSVRIGEISARPFNVNKEGFFRGIDINGNGKYSLRATVGVGEVVLAR
jgi:hypothetical protein